MAIYLVQHGLSLAKETDPERGLSQTGVDQVKLIAGVAADYAIEVKRIFHSGKKRARETAEVFAEALQPVDGILEITGISPMDDVIAFASTIDSASNAMFVGHLPFMERLVSQLTTGSAEYRPFKFQNGGIVCLDRDDREEYFYVKWALMPNIT